MGNRELSPAGLLLTAAAEVERAGLCRGHFMTEDGAICPITAMARQVVPGPFLIPWWEADDVQAPAVYVEAVLAVNRYLGWPVPPDVHHGEEQIMAWVDGHVSGTAEAVETLRNTAYSLRKAIAAVERV